VPAADLEAKTLEIARRLAAGPRLAHRFIKDNLNRAMNASFAECLDTESANLMQLRDTDDHKEAARTFAEKRPPRFTGR
jgi:2-(1,2-epoxy-1,2-dihydrophenyl)acetyl-CoA isomerase